MNTPFYILLFKLLFAHVVADFYLQGNKMAKEKLNITNSDSSNKTKAVVTLVAHSFIHAVCAYIIVWDWKLWIIPLVILISHFIIDFIKALSGNNDSPWHFILDQFMHLVVIGGIAWTSIGFGVPQIYASNSLPLSIKLIAVLTTYLIIAKPTSIFLKTCLQGITPSQDNENGMDKAGKQGIVKGGKWIGYLERLLVVTFIITQNFSAIGFLIAAKSIFRFGDLKDQKDRIATEYVLIGTLASFTIAIFAGLFLEWILMN